MAMAAMKYWSIRNSDSAENPLTTRPAAIGSDRLSSVVASSIASAPQASFR